MHNMNIIVELLLALNSALFLLLLYNLYSQVNEGAVARQWRAVPDSVVVPPRNILCG
jgi:hypothetical protein